ncbi:MAG: amino acid adenylation domain-containing protein, partial [Halanaerobiales bacterium]|nr:amino acid adenylation domain-containing protein [Halanaerobiales bacterium]
YLPIDPVYPEDRIKYMLEDSDAKILLTENSLIQNLNEIEVESIDLYDEKIYSGETELENITLPNNLAYVIYTSGSTGKPKGVMLEHRNVANLVSGLDQQIYAQYQRRLNVCVVSPYVFDASVKQIFAALLLGHSLYIVPENTRLSGLKLLEFYEKYNIDVSDGTPTHISLLLENMEEKHNELGIKHFVIGGEALTKNLAESFLSRFTNSKPIITNVYGPTECCVDSSSYDVTIDNYNLYDMIPIGKPMPNVQLYIMDQKTKLQSIGIPGELCISGAGVSRGYLRREELTAEKFITNPFREGERLYRTGDLVSWLPDGNIKFIGRIDHQVKIRGYRIELGEIENRLLEHEIIREAIVIDRTDQNDAKYLCAYIVTDEEIPVADLRTYLSKDLPEYMIPSYFISLDEMPLTRNGKVDRKALPAPEGNLELGTEYVAPRDEAEEKMSLIWSEVLSVEKVGINDNFFELGGHSLKAIQLTAKILKEFNVEMPLQEIFKTPTVKDLAQFVRKAKKTLFTAIEPVEMREYYPVSSAQKRLYALKELEGENITYNMPTVLILEGELDKEHFTNVFQKLIERHEAFRTSFEIIDGEIVQRIHDEVEFELKELEIAESELENTVKELIRPFDLSTAPLLRVTLVKFAENKHVLIADMHHIISDGFSMRNLISDLVYLFADYDLPKLRLQYKDFAVWQNELFASEMIKKQEEYWLETFAGEIPVLNLLTDNPRPAIMTYEGDKIQFNLDKELTNQLNYLIVKHGATLFMTLLSTYNILLAKLSGQEDIIVGSPIAGRKHADLESIIGMFVNTLVFRNYPEGNKRFVDFLEEVKEKSLEAYQNQDYQFDMLVDQLNLERDLSRNPLFDVMFVVQNISTDLPLIDNADKKETNDLKIE